MPHPIEAKSWKTWLGAMKAINRAGLEDSHAAVLSDRGIVAIAREIRDAAHELHRVILQVEGDHFHGCPTPTGRPFDCDYCQDRAANMGGVR